MSDDRDDDDTPPADSKSGKGPKKRFQERDDSDDEGDDDRPRRKRRVDDDDDRPKKRREEGDDEGDEDRPKKRRRADDDGPRVKANDSIPIVMLLAFIGSAVALLAGCVSCGWFSFAWLAGDSGGGGGNEFEVVSVSRTGNPRQPFSTVSWTVTAKQTPSSSGYYYAVAQSGGHKVEKQLTGVKKGETRTFNEQLSNPSSTLEVWVEHRTTPVGAGKKVSNVSKVQ